MFFHVFYETHTWHFSTPTPPLEKSPHLQAICIWKKSSFDIPVLCNPISSAFCPTKLTRKRHVESIQERILVLGVISRNYSTCNSCTSSLFPLCSSLCVSSKCSTHVFWKIYMITPLPPAPKNNGYGCPMWLCSRHLLYRCKLNQTLSDIVCSYTHESCVGYKLFRTQTSPCHDLLCKILVR